MYFRIDDEMNERISDNSTNIQIGTLAQVLAFKEETEHDLTAMKMRVVGRQRFKVLTADMHNGFGDFTYVLKHVIREYT